MRRMGAPPKPAPHLWNLALDQRRVALHQYSLRACQICQLKDIHQTSRKLQRQGARDEGWERPVLLAEDTWPKDLISTTGWPPRVTHRGVSATSASS